MEGKGGWLYKGLHESWERRLAQIKIRSEEKGGRLDKTKFNPQRLGGRIAKINFDRGRGNVMDNEEARMCDHEAITSVPSSTWGAI